MIISVASGKGGTGKTTVATCLALAVNEEVQLLDCDVEEPNAHIFIKPKITNRVPVAIPMPRINMQKCNLCGRCSQICAFNALAVLKDKVLLYSELCHGCGACTYLCPQNAIEEVGKEIGYIEFGCKGKLKFIQGVMSIGEVLATPIIRFIKEHIDASKITVIDAPPGTSCPMIESVKHSDYCILVTEPTPFGLNDLILAVEALRKLQIPFGVVINRSDLGSKEVENYCNKENISILLTIPFKREIASAYSKGISIVQALPEYREKFKKLMATVLNFEK